MASETPDSTGRVTKSAISIPLDGESKFEITGVGEHDLLVALPPVSVRVDAPSLSGTIYTMRLVAGVFGVTGDEPFVMASTGRWGAFSVSLSSGKVLQGAMPQFAAFSRWSLVIDDAEQEVVIATFGQQDSQ
jgi:hypothetical protein